MKSFKLYLLFIALSIIVTSCTKVIDLKLGNNTGDLVIEGNITNVQGPQIIKLSLNVPFTNTNTYPTVTGATISVSDQAGNTYPCVESPAGTYSTSQFAGISGNTYTMNVSSKGKIYTAISVMPAVVALDSVTAEKNDFNSSNNRKKITVHYKDPSGVVNQYNFLLFVNNVQVKAIFANNDQFTDGNNVSLDLNQDLIDIYPGDTVTVEMQCVDLNIYTYWFTLMQQGNNGPGGSVTPSNPPTNITPTTLGYFSAHSTQTKTILVK
jgi:hypothetical protein